MRKIHSTLRLFFEAGLSIRAVARTLRVSPSTVGDSIRRAKVAGLSWPLPEGLDERVLEARLFPGAGVPAPAQRAMPDWAHVHAELRRKGVTLSLLWQEYKGEHPEGLQSSQFCERYRAFRQGVDVVMRHNQKWTPIIGQGDNCTPPPLVRLPHAALGHELLSAYTASGVLRPRP